MGLSWICTIHMNTNRRYVVACEAVISAVLICFLLSISIYTIIKIQLMCFLTMIMTHIEQNVNKVF